MLALHLALSPEKGIYNPRSAVTENQTKVQTSSIYRYAGNPARQWHVLEYDARVVSCQRIGTLLHITASKGFQYSLIDCDSHYLRCVILVRTPPIQFVSLLNSLIYVQISS